MVSFTDHCNAISIGRLPSKTKIEKDWWKRFSSASFFIKNTKNNQSSASDWWEYTKCCFKENAKVLSKDPTTQDLVLKRMLELFLKVPPLKKLQFWNQKNENEICINTKFRAKNQTNDWKLLRWTLSIRKQTRKRC